MSGHDRHVDVCETADCRVCASYRAEQQERAEAWDEYRWHAVQAGQWFDPDERDRQARLTEATS